MAWIADSQPTVPSTLVSQPTARSRRTQRTHTQMDIPGEDAHQKVPLGAAVFKTFEEGVFEGVVVAYDPAEDWYKVQYSDGEVEELDWLELVEVLPTRPEQPSPMERWSNAHDVVCNRCGEAEEDPDDAFSYCYYCNVVIHEECISLATPGNHPVLDGMWVCTQCMVSLKQWLGSDGVPESGDK